MCASIIPSRQRARHWHTSSTLSVSVTWPEPRGKPIDIGTRDHGKSVKDALNNPPNGRHPEPTCACRVDGGKIFRSLAQNALPEAVFRSFLAAFAAIFPSLGATILQQPTTVVVPSTGDRKNDGKGKSVSARVNAG